MILHFAHALQEQIVSQLWWKCRRAKSKEGKVEPGCMIGTTSFNDASDKQIILIYLFNFQYLLVPSITGGITGDRRRVLYGILFCLGGDTAAVFVNVEKIHSHISLPSLSIRGWSDHLPAHFPHIHLSLPWYCVFNSGEVASRGTRLRLLMYRPLVWCLGLESLLWATDEEHDFEDAVQNLSGTHSYCWRETI